MMNLPRSFLSLVIGTSVAAASSLAMAETVVKVSNNNPVARSVSVVSPTNKTLIVEQNSSGVATTTVTPTGISMVSGLPFYPTSITVTPTYRTIMPTVTPAVTSVATVPGTSTTVVTPTPNAPVTITNGVNTTNVSKPVAVVSTTTVTPTVTPVVTPVVAAPVVTAAPVVITTTP
jgi:hypothetical protein